MKAFPLIFCLMMLSNTLIAQQPYDYLGNFQLDSLDKWAQKQAHGPREYYQSLALVFKLLMEDQAGAFSDKAHLEKKWLQQLAGLPEPQRSHYQQEIKLHFGLLKLKFNQEWAGGWQLYKVLKKQQQLQAQYPEYTPLRKITGITEAACSMIPKKYIRTAKWFGIQKGSFENGIKQLRLAQNTDFGYEAALLESLLWHFLANDTPKALNSLAGNDHLHQYFQALMLKKDRQSPKAMAKFIRLKDQLPDFRILDYHLGDLHLRAGQLREAIHYFSLFNQGKGQDFKADAYFKTAVCWQILGKQIAAQQALNNIPICNNQTYADRYAHKMATKGLHDDPRLQQIRFHLDGGYTALAAKTFEEITFEELSTKNQLLYFYRKGMLMEAEERWLPALSFYERTIAHQTNQEEYYAPSACLKMAQIYVRQGNHEKAHFYYKKCLEYTDHPYKKSLDQKAKAGLTLLNDHNVPTARINQIPPQ
ncbi:lipopolysaccharide assembly protein LapB [Persicobacter sp. CCB-QB2]|uniref:tetratricopeptide repeat protein n=1 Tax=Persicobacter sp. CCB-QB2 TaxID=1561025 RepID=UPI0009E2A5F4|nr:hypothetical protein [Persicobacter sp. CCB-QB2]